MEDIILEATSTELNYSAGVIGPIQSQFDCIKNNLATVEPEFIATRKYKKGEYFIYSDILYVVTNDVSIGSDFVIETNVNQIYKGILNNLMSNYTRKKWDAILEKRPLPPDPDESESE